MPGVMASTDIIRSSSSVVYEAWEYIPQIKAPVIYDGVKRK